MNERYRFILVLLVGVGAVRLLLLDRGALALPDEWLYLKSLAALEHLAGARDVLRAEAGLIASAPHEQRRAVFESRHNPGFDDSATRALQLPAKPSHLDARRRVTLVNFGYFYPLYPDDHRPYAPGPGERLAYRRLHWLNHPAYYLEGYSVEERRLLRQRRYHVQLWVGKTEDVE